MNKEQLQQEALTRATPGKLGRSHGGQPSRRAHHHSIRPSSLNQVEELRAQNAELLAALAEIADICAGPAATLAELALRNPVPKRRETTVTRISDLSEAQS